MVGLQDLVKAVEEAASAAGVRLRPLDKKAEKAAVQVQRQALQDTLNHETDPATALSLAVPLLVMQVMPPSCTHVFTLTGTRWNEALWHGIARASAHMLIFKD